MQANNNLKENNKTMFKKKQLLIKYYVDKLK